VEFEHDEDVRWYDCSAKQCINTTSVKVFSESSVYEEDLSAKQSKKNPSSVEMAGGPKRSLSVKQVLAFRSIFLKCFMQLLSY
jgi:hypothetical protein